jgi:microcystin-dependent protein
MADPFVAEIRIFAGNFAPTGWAFCNGQIMAISQNTALFSLLGTTYGGNGQSTFALPNLQGSAPLQAGQGSGLSQRVLGEPGGQPGVTLLPTEMPAHTHTLQANAIGGDVNSPANAVWAKAHTGKSPINVYNDSVATNSTTMNPGMLAAAGGSQPHNNMPPYLALNFIIALQGVFPSRS